MGRTRKPNLLDMIFAESDRQAAETHEQTIARTQAKARELSALREAIRGRAHIDDFSEPALVEAEDMETQPWQEYLGAADWCAVRGLKGKVGDALPELLSVECHELINADPEAFETEVRNAAYARAMQRHEQAGQ